MGVPFHFHKVTQLSPTRQANSNSTSMQNGNFDGLNGGNCQFSDPGSSRSQLKSSLDPKHAIGDFYISFEQEFI